MRILLTGASGFLGKIISATLVDESITTLGRSNAHVICDLRKEVPQLSFFDIVVHCAGKAHLVPKNEYEKQDFFSSNVTGTHNLLKGLEKSTLPRSFVFISTVAVYGNDCGDLISEETPLLASDPYGRSKIEVEKLIIAWCEKWNIRYAILRLPLLAGPNPPGNLRSMINGIQRGYYFNIAGGTARKSMVLAEDVARIIPKAASIGGIYNLTDGYHPSFYELSELIAKQLRKSVPLTLPLWLAQIIAEAGDFLGRKAPLNTLKLQKIISDLTFDDSKARKVLNWDPKPVLQRFEIS